MKIVRFNEAENYEPEKDWKRISLCNEKEISIEHFVKPAKHASPNHEHPSAQVLVVLQGKLVLESEKEEVELQKGDSVFIPGNERHIVKNPLEEVSVGLDIFIPGRSFDFWLKRKA